MDASFRSLSTLLNGTFLGAYEGYACAALVAKYGRPALESLTSPSTSTSLQRAPTFTPGDMKKAQHNRQSSPHSTTNFVRRSATSSLRPESPRPTATKLLISEGDIEEKFRLAIENYQKVSTDCIMVRMARYAFFFSSPSQLLSNAIALSRRRQFTCWIE